MSGAGDPPATRPDVAAFLEAAKAVDPATRGRLIFALDATMSRQPTWDLAATLQAEMFEEAGRVGGLDVQLVYFRGFRECRASAWTPDAARLGALMARIDCRSGETQIGRVLRHAAAETRRRKVSALVYVGDACEEAPDRLAAEAGELGLLGVKAFLFHEGGDPGAAAVFADIARLTGGVALPFDRGSAGQLGELLRAVAAYATGGMRALTALGAKGQGGARRLLGHIRMDSRGS
jgi:hypothetical protein